MYEFIDGLSHVTGVTIGLVLTLLFAWLIANTVRRVLGVRVGWPRTLVVSLILVYSLSELTTDVLQYVGISESTEITDSNVVAVMALSGLVGLWGFALAALVLVVLEIMLPTGSLPTLRSLFFGWGKRWRRFGRFVEVGWIFFRNGLASQLRGFRSPDKQADGGHAVARSLRIALDQCGITFIKAGQMLSTRADLLPPAFVKELSTLQTTAEPEEWAAVRRSLEGCLGREVEEVFAEINPVPLAAASSAQVHVGQLRDGGEVVVKVQRPDAARAAELDLDILQLLSRILDANAPWARRMGIIDLAEGFAASLREELDYRIEIDNMSAMRASLDRRGVRIPRVEQEMSSAKLIVMERFDGKPVSKAAAEIAALHPEQRVTAADTLLRAVLDQIVKDGIFHADLHAGNVFIWPDGGVGLLDFGSVGRIDATSRRALTRLLWAIDADDPVTATDALLGIVDAPRSLDERQLTREVGALLAKFRGGFGVGGGSAQVFSELFQLMLDHGLGIPPSLAAALRSLGALEGTLKLINPELDLVDAARAVGRESVAELSSADLKGEVLKHLMHVLPLLEHMPHRINRISEDLESGSFRAHVRLMSDPEDRRYIESLVQQLVTAALAVGAVLGGILLIITTGGPMLMDKVSLFSVLGGLLAFAGFVLSLRSVALVFSRGS